MCLAQLAVKHLSMPIPKIPAGLDNRKKKQQVTLPCSYGGG